jgi:hypothetical protein
LDVRSCHSATGAQSISHFADEEIEKLAEMEHERWWDERRADGWSLGEEKDEKLKKNPYTVEWDELPPDIADLDREFMRAISACSLRWACRSFGCQRPDPGHSTSRETVMRRIGGCAARVPDDQELLTEPRTLSLPIRSHRLLRASITSPRGMSTPPQIAIHVVDSWTHGSCATHVAHGANAYVLGRQAEPAPISPAKVRLMRYPNGRLNTCRNAITGED